MQVGDRVTYGGREATVVSGRGDRVLVRFVGQVHEMLADLPADKCAVVRAWGDASIVKACACGRTFTRAQWGELAYVGLHEDDVEVLEMRNCLCGSTLAIEVTK